jgi:hypothetical protein
VKVWVNGHEWAKQQARKLGLGFTELARIIEPTSKQDSLRVLEEAGVDAASYPTLNRRVPVIYYQYRADRRRTLGGIDEQVAKAEKDRRGKIPVKRNRFITLADGEKSVTRELEAKARELWQVTALRCFGYDSAKRSFSSATQNRPNVL